MSKDIHVMIDLETLSTEQDAAVIAIGAQVFSAGGLGDDWFYDRINPKLAEKYGSVSKETMLWWDKPENAVARLEAFGGVSNPKDTWFAFATWLYNLVSEAGHTHSSINNTLDIIYPWSNGADFDLPILKNAMLEFNGEYPINFRNHRCYRTLKNLVRHEHHFDDIVHKGKHNALEDARYQARVATRALSVVGYW